MIQRLELENLKCFGGRHEAELAPITVVYGPNSSGKSSLMQALAVLKQTLETQSVRTDLERQPLSLRGDLVDLGSFPTVVHRHEQRRPLHLGVRFSAGPPRPDVRPRLRADATGYVRLGFRFNAKQHAMRQSEVTMGVDEHAVRYVPATSPPTHQEPVSVTEPRFRVANESAGRALFDLFSDRLALEGGHTADLAASFAEFLAYDPCPTFLGRGCFPISPSLRAWRTDGAEPKVPLPNGVAHLSALVSDVVFGPAVVLIEVLSRLAYLGPLRAAPTRFQARSGAVYSSVGARGEHTPLVLLQQPSLLRVVNRWLKQLGVTYSMKVTPIHADVIGAEIGDLIVTQLVDTRTGVSVTPPDVGFGISQLLPVVVEVLSGNGRTVCIEQPEIHVHPRLQAELADLFIEAAERNGNQVVIETHSEHLMLRFLRRLRENDGGWLTPERISVLYVDQDHDGVSHVQRLRLDESGEFIDEWPKGFFTERLHELFPARRSRTRSAKRR